MRCNGSLIRPSLLSMLCSVLNDEALVCLFVKDVQRPPAMTTTTPDDMQCELTDCRARLAEALLLAEEAVMRHAALKEACTKSSPAASASADVTELRTTLQARDETIRVLRDGIERGQLGRPTTPVGSINQQLILSQQALHRMRADLQAEVAQRQLAERALAAARAELDRVHLRLTSAREQMMVTLESFNRVQVIVAQTDKEAHAAATTAIPTPMTTTTTIQ